MGTSFEKEHERVWDMAIRRYGNMVYGDDDTTIKEVKVAVSDK